jgi:L-asparaginase II
MNSATSSNTSPTLPKHVPIAYSTRGGHVENVFYGSIAVVDRTGQLIASQGDAETPMFTRSSLKPFQAIPLVSHPNFADLALTLAETALLCASHNGEEMHANAAKAMLARASLTDAALQCGSHVPYWYSAKDQRPPEGQHWSSLFHNCSGKHSGMLLYAHLKRASNENYLDFDHAVQSDVRQAIMDVCGWSLNGKLPWGTDGCSAPNYALPLSALARGFAWLTTTDRHAQYGDAASRIFAAMTAHPEMVSGVGRNDLALARAGRGDWINKVGADGVQTLASRSRGIGIAAKVSDGNLKALMVAFCAVLEKLGMMDDAARAALKAWSSVPIKSIRGVEVGRIEPHVQLNDRR